MDKHLFAIWAVFALGAWIAWLVFGALRQFTAAKVHIALQDRLLRHVSSPETLSTFLNSPSGDAYLRTLERDPQHPWQRVIGGLQAAVAFGVVGLGGVLAAALWQPTEPVMPFAYAALVIAVALGAATTVGFYMYRRAGLLS